MVIQSVVRVQEDSGRATEEIAASTRPMAETSGFDSLSGIEVTVALSQSLGQEIQEDNLFVSQNGKRALSISEIADNLCKIIGFGPVAMDLETVRS